MSGLIATDSINRMAERVLGVKLPVPFISDSNRLFPPKTRKLWRTAVVRATVLGGERIVQM
ncbi:hypothetical protein PHO31112_02806 [Pandoraea horticolens]|uniref:Uncharacterized protein n=1 Tax=Pandoraea horticolens TaxID=2508298 RepID=A0A5E4VSU1_9BURK|nr:hypothetical protein PHO31112_02806 [Pandoraea horticolens]